MLKYIAILLAATSITACENKTTTTPETTEQQNANAAALKKATEAAIIIESYNPGANSVTPAHNYNESENSRD